MNTVRSLAPPLALFLITLMPPCRPDSRRLELFDEVWGLCVEHFHSASSAPDWQDLRRRYRPAVGTASSEQLASAGRPFLLRGGSLLMLAVKPRNAAGTGEDTIEGKGVRPDVLVQFPLEYAGGKDPQLESAIEAARKLIR